MIRQPPRSTLSSSSAASDVYKRQPNGSGEANRGGCEGGGVDVDFEQGVCCGDGVLKSEEDDHGLPALGELRLPPQLAHVDLSLIHISEPTRLLSISYAVFCLKKKKITPIILKYEYSIIIQATI
eukprot:TRINITY_DN52147_c0_g1_i1.p2 TRINITY_DN52147_c0_g1~~TRINITY_DN52147_c0_g1_i1.p2  ORF type:complete len:125 (+),score=27.79 TRINITY_DN52147_c0_g1_i1:88-462(+)